MVEHLSKFKYDTSKYRWRESFISLYGVPDLSELHKYLPDFDHFTTPNDSWHLLYKIYYSNFKRVFEELYIAFLPELLNIVGEPFYFQKIPCARFGLPGRKWLKEFHVDSDYNHPKDEINFNLAITQSTASAALQIESKPENADYIPLEQVYGEFTCIDHIGCRHGSIINNTNKTFISIDFRILPKSSAVLDQQSATKKSILAQLKFRPGDYFSSYAIMAKN